MLCLQFLELLEFLQGFKAFLSQSFDFFTNISPFFLSDQWCSIYRQSFVCLKCQVAPTSYARRRLVLEESSKKGVIVDSFF